MNPVRIAIVGCTGRVGSRLVQLSAADPELALISAVARAGHPCIGQDAGTATGGKPIGVDISAELVAPCDVVVEFSTCDGLRAAADWCGSHRCALVSGTTGVGEPEHAALREAARGAAILWSPNMSVGANLLVRISADVAAILGQTYDIEIVETHHSQKRDAPSGTALAIANAICDRIGRDPRTSVVTGRAGQMGPRKPGEIGVHAVRMGDHVGEHEVHLSTAGESILLRHRATSRDTFARGALQAAKWLRGRKPGRYGMMDVIGRPT